MELRHLRYFLAVADAGSFTRAAEVLHLAQPALSLQIRSLERELGVTLIERGARTRGLTEAGTRFAARSRRILLEAGEAAREMAEFAGARAGRVRFGSALQSLTEGRLAPLLARFHRLRPGVRVAFREAHTQPLLEMLARGEIDLALVHLGKLDGTPASAAAAEGASIEIEGLYDEALVLAVSRRHRVAGRRSVSWKEIAREEFVSFGAGATVRGLLEQAARHAGIELRRPISASNLGTVRALVSAGLGVAILPRVALELPGPPLCGVRLTAPALARTVALARNPIRYESPSTRAFADFVREGLRAGFRNGAPATTPARSTGSSRRE